jgi:hypothetical protein
MAERDYSEYEKRRARDHEDTWRYAAMLINIPDRHCHYRLCRRHQACYGPMLTSNHQLGMVQAQKEIGLSGAACASLPMCVANATADHYAYVRGMRQSLMDLRSTSLKNFTSSEFLFMVRQSMRRLYPGRSAPLTSPAQQPTSASKHEGGRR